jgi:hypothetical protein
MNCPHGEKKQRNLTQNNTGPLYLPACLRLSSPPDLRSIRPYLSKNPLAPSLLVRASEPAHAQTDASEVSEPRIILPPACPAAACLARHRASAWLARLLTRSTVGC